MFCWKYVPFESYKRLKDKKNDPIKKGGFRTKSKINMINMWKNGGKAVRNRDGKIIKEAQYQSSSFFRR